MIIDVRVPERIELAERMSREKYDEFCGSLPEYLEMLETPQGEYDCFVYALGPEADEVDTIYELCDLVADDDREPGDILIYIRGGKGPTHAAVYEGNHTVRSKWGGGGPVFRHKIDHIPLGWGNIALFFRKKTA